MTTPPFQTTGLHPDQIRALRDHKGLSTSEFAQLFGCARRRVEKWEADGLSRGPVAVAVRAVADKWSFQFPAVEGSHGECTICHSEGYHLIAKLPVCRACYFTPADSMRKIGYEVAVEGDLFQGAELEVNAPAARGLTLPPTLFGPEDWRTAVRKRLGTEEHQTGHAEFDDLVFIGYIEPETRASLDDETVRHLIEDLVPHGQLELIGDAARMHIFKRNARPLDELVLRLGLLMARLCENA